MLARDAPLPARISAGNTFPLTLPCRRDYKLPAFFSLPTLDQGAMDGISGFLLLAAILIIMQFLVVAICDRAPALRQWKSLLMIVAMIWWFTPLIKKAYVDDVFYPNDSVVHEEAAREIAYLIHQGDMQGAWDYFGFGNEGYRFVLGLLYAYTDAPEVVTYSLHGMFAFWGMLLIIEMICKQISAARIPCWIVLFIMLNPSALFWTTFNLKEGAMLWGLCAMLKAAQAFGENQRGSHRESLVVPALGLLVAGFLRPHIVMAYLGGLAVGVAVKQKKISFALAMFGGIFAAVSMLKVMAPVFFENVAAAGLSNTLSERFMDLSNDGGSAITYSRGAPIPLISGVILLALRPFPWEAGDLTTLAAGAEIWVVAVIATLGWYRLNQRWHFATSAYVMTLIMAFFALSLYFTYIYNMGLMVRQRVMVFPAMLTIAVLPSAIFANARIPTFSRQPSILPQPTATPAFARRLVPRNPRRSFPATRTQPMGARPNRPVSNQHLL